MTSSEPIVSREHPTREEVDGAVLNGTCLDSAWVITDHNDCDVCLAVDQYSGTPDGRRALMRMSADEARTLVEALRIAAPHLQSKDRPLGSVQGGAVGVRPALLRPEVLEQVEEAIAEEWEADQIMEEVAGLIDPVEIEVRRRLERAAGDTDGWGTAPDDLLDQVRDEVRCSMQSELPARLSVIADALKGHNSGHAQELQCLADQLQSVQGEGEGLKRLVDKQAEDEALWFVARSANTAYIQQELRKLHEAIELADELASEPDTGIVDEALHPNSDPRRLSHLKRSEEAVIGPPVSDLEGNDVTGCVWCEAIQARDWQTVEHLSDSGTACTCPPNTTTGGKP